MDQALLAYDSYVAAAKRPDVTLLRPIAEAILRRAAESEHPAERAGALERLARAGDEAAIGALRKMAADTGAGRSSEALAPVSSLARLGDASAASRLAGLLETVPREEKAQLIKVLQDADARSEAGRIAALLGDPDVAVRVTAATAVGALGHRASVPRLQALFEQDVPVVKMAAAVALKRLGAVAADAYIAELLGSDVPDIRLAAAAALGPPLRNQWLARVRELRTDRNEMVRLRAAEVLACCEPETTRTLLSTALQSPVPPMRVEAARILETTGSADARLARRLLGDPWNLVKLHGAGAVLRLNTPKPR